jgi:hypothetical protein
MICGGSARYLPDDDHFIRHPDGTLTRPQVTEQEHKQDEAVRNEDECDDDQYFSETEDFEVQRNSSFTCGVVYRKQPQSQNQGGVDTNQSRGCVLM